MIFAIETFSYMPCDDLNRRMGLPDQSKLIAIEVGSLAWKIVASKTP